MSSPRISPRGQQLGVHTYIRDAVLSSIQWDSPTCLNAQTACTGSSWNPQMQVVFFSGHAPTHNPVINGPACNTGANLRCDDPLDLSGSSGMAAPQVQSDFALNDIEVQTRPSATASWNVLDGYQFTYAESGPATITDPATGQAESVAGALTLTQAQKYGTNYGVSGTTALPPQTFTYAVQDQSYVDSAYQPNPATSCGPTWNTGNGSGCLLWSQSYAGNDQYLASASNGQGLQTTFTWQNALNNTHGVNGGGRQHRQPVLLREPGGCRECLSLQRGERPELEPYRPDAAAECRSARRVEWQSERSHQPPATISR